MKTKSLPLNAFFVFVSLIAVFQLSAQTDNGIHFQNTSNWDQLVQKAKIENKCIFVDFYATWCAPCKQMDKEVYVQESVGKIANMHFLSVKIQVDKTNEDSEAIKNWYSDAEQLTKTYHIGTLPTLTCFTSNGSLISKDEGYQSAEQLIAILKKALTTKSGYQTLIEKYRQHEMPADSLAPLAREVRRVGNNSLADSIAADYKALYLDKLNDNEVLTKSNLEFAREFSSILNGNDRIFQFFYKYPEKADEILGLGKSQPGVMIMSSRDLVKYIISKEEINDKLYKDGKPITEQADWKMLYNNIEKKYCASYANDLVPPAKIPFYRATKNWKQYAAMIDEAIKKYPPQINGTMFANATMTGMIFQRDDWNLNSSAWDVFLHCNDKSILKKALKWSELSITIIDPKDPGVVEQYLDTKANLLYKIGKTKEAIAVETKAYDAAVQQARKAGRDGGGEGYLEIINKMKAGTPTWQVNK